MIIDHNLKNQLIIINTALFLIRMTTASASKQNIILLLSPIFILNHKLWSHPNIYTNYIIEI